MSLTLARLTGPTQAASIGARNTVHTVPAGQHHIIKSIVLHNGRSDGQSITYELGIIPSGDTFDLNKHPWIRSDSILSGQPKTLDFGMLVLNPGDVIYVNPANNSGLFYEAHGLVSQ